MNARATQLRDVALAAARRGDTVEADRLFAAATAAHPGDAALWNSRGNFLSGADRTAEALDCFAHAARLAPRDAQITINHAIALNRMGRARDALRLLEAARPALGGTARYWSTRAGIEAALPDRAAAAKSYDACLAIEPRHARAAHGRARMALERAEPGAVAAYDRALAIAPGDAQLWLGKAQALEGTGDIAEARAILDALVTQAPHWIDAAETLARLRWHQGDGAAFCEHYRSAAARGQADAALFASWSRMLGGVDRHADAADVAARGRTTWPDARELALIEASRAGMAGDDARARAILDTLGGDDGALILVRARHHLRQGDPAHAEVLLGELLVRQDDHVDAWALRDIAWRLLQDARHDWLHDTDTMIRQQSAGLSPEELAMLIDTLRAAHRHAAIPVAQSVRTGTQTTGALFDRTDPTIAGLRQAIAKTVERYRARLPPCDTAHPLLRHRDAPFAVVGSWSVLFRGAGHHVPHIHPNGVVSSAMHLVVPEDRSAVDRTGWLEIGRPPADLRLDLPPLTAFAPKAGHCVLFPSTLFHGTRPYPAGERLSVAFDLAGA